MASASSIQNNIYYYRNKIDAYERDISDLYRDIARIEEISSCLRQRIQQFAQTQEHHISVVNRISQLDINQKITSEFSSGMAQDLTGQNYQSAQDGLTSAVRVAENKIMELQQEIQQRQWQISNWQDTIVHLQRELYTLDNQ